MVYMPLPVHLASCDERLAFVREQTARLKHTDRPAATQAFVETAGGLVPPPLRTPVVRALATSRQFNLTVSQSPAPRGSLYLLGCELDEVYSVVPIAQGHGLAIGMVRYRQELFFGCYADPERCPRCTSCPRCWRASSRRSPPRRRGAANRRRAATGKPQSQWGKGRPRVGQGGAAHELAACPGGMSTAGYANARLTTMYSTAITAMTLETSVPTCGGAIAQTAPARTRISSAMTMVELDTGTPPLEQSPPGSRGQNLTVVGRRSRGALWRRTLMARGRSCNDIALSAERPDRQPGGYPHSSTPTGVMAPQRSWDDPLLVSTISSTTARRWGRDLVFHLAGLLTSIIALALWPAGVATSVSMAITYFGLLIALGTLLAFRWFAQVERRRAGLVLGQPIHERYRPPAASGAGRRACTTSWATARRGATLRIRRWPPPSGRTLSVVAISIGRRCSA